MVQKQKLVQKEEPRSHQALGHVRVLVQGLPPKVSCLKGQMKLQGQLQGHEWRLKVQVLGQELGQLPEVISCRMGQMQQQGQLQERVWRLKVLVLGQELGQLPEVIACQREQMMPLVLWQGHVLRLKALVLGLVQELQP